MDGESREFAFGGHEINSVRTNKTYQVRLSPLDMLVLQDWDPLLEPVPILETTVKISHCFL